MHVKRPVFSLLYYRLEGFPQQLHIVIIERGLELLEFFDGKYSFYHWLLSIAKNGTRGNVCRAVWAGLPLPDNKITIFCRFYPLPTKESACRSFCSMGSAASIQWMVNPRRSIPRNQVICRFANWWIAISSCRNISSWVSSPIT